jgi:hypothetical protein
MQITVTFDSLEEMKDFTESVLVGRAKTLKVSDPKRRENTGVPVRREEGDTVGTKQPVSKVPTAGQMPSAAPAVPTTPVQASAVPAVPTTSVQTSSVTYTPDDLARAAMALMDCGKQQDLIALLGQFGVVAIPELRPEQYGAFATALRGMGAQI